MELDGRFQSISNRESGFGRYDVMLISKDRKKDCAYIIEFKVHKPWKEKDLAETVANALDQIEEKSMERSLPQTDLHRSRSGSMGLRSKGRSA